MEQVAAFLAALVIPVAFLGASTLVWRNGGSRSRVLAATVGGVFGATVAFALVGAVVDLEDVTAVFAVLLIGLSAATVLVARRRLGLG